MGCPGDLVESVISVEKDGIIIIIGVDSIVKKRGSQYEIKNIVVKNIRRMSLNRTGQTRWLLLRFQCNGRGKVAGSWRRLHAAVLPVSSAGGDRAKKKVLEKHAVNNY